MSGWRITIDMQGGSRIHDDVYRSGDYAMMLSAAVEDALEKASLTHAEPGDGAYQITATPDFS